MQVLAAGCGPGRVKTPPLLCITRPSMPWRILDNGRCGLMLPVTVDRSCPRSHICSLKLPRRIRVTLARRRQATTHPAISPSTREAITRPRLSNRPESSCTRPQDAAVVRIWRGFFPVHRLNACVNPLTSLKPSSQAILDICSWGSSRYRTAKSRRSC
jgi:hypothetical protein